MIRRAVRIQFLLCGEMLQMRGWGDEEMQPVICGKPARHRIRWTDGSSTYVCEACASGPMRRDDPALV